MQGDPLALPLLNTDLILPQVNPSKSTQKMHHSFCDMKCDENTGTKSPELGKIPQETTHTNNSDPSTPYYPPPVPSHAAIYDHIMYDSDACSVYQHP